MFNIIFFIIFTLALLIGNIYFFRKKLYLYFFIPCMLFLPDYYGISINDSFPVVSIARLMFIVFYVYVFVHRKRSLNWEIFKIKKDNIPYYLLCGYFFFRILTNLYYITAYGQATKTILLIIFEQLMLLVAFYILNPSKAEYHTLIKSIVWSATALYIIGLFESFTSIRPFDALYTVSRTMMNEHYVRLGLLRSTTTMGLPGLFGNMCVLTLVLILYLYYSTLEKKYLAIIPFNILAIIHSGSRSDIIFLFGVITVYVFLFCLSKKRIIDFLIHFSIISSVIVLFIGALSFAKPEYRYFYETNAKAVLNEFGADYDLNEGAPKGVDGYGVNYRGGSRSRVVQFTGITYTLEHNPLFGLGSGADMRKDLHYYWDNTWWECSWYDLGIVEIICLEGLIGLLAHVLLFAAIAFFLLRIFHSNINISKFLILFLFTYLLTTLSTQNMYSFLILYIIVCAHRYQTLFK